MGDKLTTLCQLNWPRSDLLPRRENAWPVRVIVHVSSVKFTAEFSHISVCPFPARASSVSTDVSDPSTKTEAGDRLPCGPLEYVRARAELLEVCQARASWGIAAACARTATRARNNAPETRGPSSPR